MVREGAGSNDLGHMCKAGLDLHTQCSKEASEQVPERTSFIGSLPQTVTVRAPLLSEFRRSFYRLIYTVIFYRKTCPVTIFYNIKFVRKPLIHKKFKL